MKNLFLLIFSLVGLNGVYAQEVSAIADKNAILIGEPVQLDLKAGFNSNSNLKWFEIENIQNFEILERSPIDTQLINGRTELSQTLLITGWDSGTFKIPVFRLGRSGTKAIDIRVSFSEMDPNQPYHDIKNILPVDKPKSSKWYWYLIFGGLLVILFLLFFPSAKTNVIKKEPLVADPYEDALKQLERLRPENTTDPKIFHSMLVHIFRQYLLRKKNIQSFSKTTDDLALQIRNLNLPEEDYGQLVQSLQLSDMVKFAKYQPLPDENAQALVTIRRSIETIEKQTHAV